MAANFNIGTASPYVAVDGRCALIEALENADNDAQVHPDCPAGSGPDVIRINSIIQVNGATLFAASMPGVSDTGFSGLPEINTDITIFGGRIQRSGTTPFRFLVINPSGSLTLRDTELRGGRVEGNCAFSITRTGCGGAIVVNGGTLLLEGAKLSDNHAVESITSDYPRGGAIAAFGGTVSVADSELTDNSAEGGGAIALQFATADIRRSTFANNSAAASGGAIQHVGNTTVTVMDGVFNGNQAAGSPFDASAGGGAIDNAGSNGQLVVTNTDFNANSAGNGGAIRNFNASDAFISNSRFVGNSAGNGGALFNSGSGATTTLYDSLLDDNEASTPGAGDGGAIRNGGVTGTGILHLLNTRITGNHAGDDGGGIWSSGELNISYSHILGNTAQDGGAIFTPTVTGQQVNILASRLESNFAGGDGGGIFFSENPSGVTANELKVDASTIHDNEADEGGGLFATYTDVEIRNSTLSDNRATSGSGGGTHLAGNIAGGFDVKLENSTVSGNSATSSGGGVYLGFSTASMKLLGSTITGNTGNAGTSGDGIHNLSPAAAVRVQDSIFQANGDRNCIEISGFGVSDDGNNLSSDDSCGFADTGSAGIGDSTSALLSTLADNGGATRTHALLSASPAINNGSVDCADRDQRGGARNSTCDIGAFEFGAALATLSMTVDTTTLFETDGTVATVTLTLDNTGSAAVADVDVPIRVTGSATGIDTDYSLDIQDALGDGEPGKVDVVNLAAAAGAISTETFTFTTLDDDLVEADETILVEASVIGGAIVSGSDSLTLTIISEDERPWDGGNCYVIRKSTSRLFIPCL